MAGAGYRNWGEKQPNDCPGSGDGTGADFATLQKTGIWADYGDKLKYSMCEMKSVCLQCCTITVDNCYQSPFAHLPTSTFSYLINHTAIKCSK